MFDKHSAFDPEHPSRSYQPTPLPGVNDVRVGSTRKLGVVEIDVRDLEEIIHELTRIARQIESKDSSGHLDLQIEEQVDRLHSHLPG